MKIYKITEASEYLGVSINTLKTLANNGKIKSFKTAGEHRRFRQEVGGSSPSLPKVTYGLNRTYGTVWPVGHFGRGLTHA